jgi:uncharacterized phage protein (TIGR02218 family)
VVLEEARFHQRAAVKPASTALIALLSSSTEFIMADLFTFTLQGGTQYLFSGGQTAITDQATGRVFARGPRFERTTVHVVIGIQSDELDLRVYPAATDLLGALSWQQAVWQGLLDGATVQLERAFMPSWGNTSPGTVVLFAGRVSDLEASRTMVGAKVRSHLELLNIEMPRRLWQPSCNHNFGDAMCGYDRVNGKNAEGTATGIGALTFAAGAGSTATTIFGAPATASPYALGTITGTSGANAGQSRTIAGFVSGQYLTLKLAFLSAPAAGDQFRILPGCDRTLATCGGVFRNSRVTPSGYNAANAERFGGMPFVPPAENAI